MPYITYDMEKSFSRYIKEGRRHKVVTDGTAVVIDFGNRTVSRQNFSRIVALPKAALTNLGTDVKTVNVSFVQENGEKYLKLKPVDKQTCIEGSD
jgi:hypothetical protein